MARGKRKPATFAEVFDRRLPGDDEAERLFLGALLVQFADGALAKDANRILRAVTSSWFLSQAHGWFYQEMRDARRRAGKRILSRLVRPAAQDAARRTGVRNLLAFIVSLLVDQSGRDIGGNARRFRWYAVRLHDAYIRRQRILRAERELMGAWNDWDDYRYRQHLPEDWVPVVPVCSRCQALLWAEEEWIAERDGVQKDAG